MALVTVQRSPSLNTTDICCETDGVESQEEDEGKLVDNQQRSISECYFTVKGAALVLPQNECIHVYRKISTHGGDIQQHLQSMFYLLRAEDTLKMAVKLESIHTGRMRYLVVISCTGRQKTEESCLLGIDCHDRATIGMVLPVWGDTRITLDGDGGFSVSSSGRHHIFKPVSVQAMWSALQTLHKASAKASNYNYYMGGGTHTWIERYEGRIKSDRSCLNEWHAMDDLVSKRPPSPGSLRSKPMEREQTESFIRGKLKEIMLSVDLDEVTSKYIRGQLEDNLNVDLHEYKSYIDQEMLIILGQMDAASEVFEYLYLGSEWNASNLEELQRNGIGQILNVTREIDNFFPGLFDYLNVRVYDEDGTELLRHWDKTFKFIEKAKKNGSKVLVHCKMGVSRSASVVVAYAMKAYNWNLQHALEFVKNKRGCIKPNTGFMKQLETYQGILDASKQRHNTLWRSKSETDLKSPQQELHPSPDALMNPEPLLHHENLFLEVPGSMHRPKSWSPEDNVANLLFPKQDTVDHHQSSARKSNDERIRSFTDPSVDAIVEAKNKHMLLPGRNGQSYSVSPNKVLHLTVASRTDEEKVKFSIGDGEDYSPVYECRNPLLVEDVYEGNVLTAVNPLERVSSVKDRINELELQLGVADAKAAKDQLINLPELRGLVLNLANQFEGGSKPNTPSPVEEDSCEEEVDLPPPLTAKDVKPGIEGNDPVVSQTKPPAPRHQAVLLKTETWAADAKTCKPTTEEWQEKPGSPSCCGSIEMVKKKDDLLMKVRVNAGSSFDSSSPAQKHEHNNNSSRNVSHQPETTGSAAKAPFVVANGSAKKVQIRDGSAARKEDPFSAQLDRVFDREEQFQRKSDSGDGGVGEPPSRQSSWGSCDSAIVIPKHERKESPSRQSSWGSSDSHCATELSREGSWSSADCYRFTRSSTTTHPFRFGHQTSSVPDSQYSSPGTDCHFMPFSYPQHDPTRPVATVERAKEKDGTCQNNSSSSSGQGNLKRTNSFDGSLLVNLSKADADVVGSSAASPIQRSQSLRTGNGGARLPRRPLPNLRLHTPTPYKSPNEKETSAQPLRETAEGYSSKILHCASFPFLAQNAEKHHPACGARVHSASHPNIRTSPPSSDAGLVINHDKMKKTFCLDFSQVCEPLSTGSHLSPDESVAAKPKGKDAASPASGGANDAVVGIVKQQKKVLEKKIASGSSPDQLPPESDFGRWQDVKGQQSPVLGSSPETDDHHPLGKVKRLTKQLESKSTTTVATKDGPLAADPEAAAGENVAATQLTIERSLSSPAMHVAVANQDATKTKTTSPEEKSVRNLVGKFELNKDGSRPRYYSENETVFRTLLGGDAAAAADQPTTVRSLASPRESARKQLGLDKDRKPETTKSSRTHILPRSPSLPLGSKCLAAELAKKNERNERRRASDFSPACLVTSAKEASERKTVISPCVKVSTSKPVARVASKSKPLLFSTDASPSLLPAIPQPPPLPAGLGPRKLRKSHGKTHPLNKLLVAKQRHPSALYNTM